MKHALNTLSQDELKAKVLKHLRHKYGYVLESTRRFQTYFVNESILTTRFEVITHLTVGTPFEKDMEVHKAISDVLTIIINELKLELLVMGELTK